MTYLEKHLDIGRSARRGEWAAVSGAAFGLSLVLLAGCGGSGDAQGGTSGASGSPGASGSGGSASGGSGSGGSPSGGSASGGSSGGSGSAGGSSGAQGSTSAGQTGASAATGASGEAQTGAAGSATGEGGDASVEGGASGGAGGSTSGATSGTSGDGGNGVGTTSGLSLDSDRVIVTGVRAVATPLAQSTIHVHNGGAVAAQVTALTLSGPDASLFKVNTSLPATVMPGADFAVDVELLTTSAALPAAPTNKDLGSNLLTGTLTATTSSGSLQATVYGLVLIQTNWEPTLGQILTTLGFKLNVGKAQNNWNPNTSMNALTLPGIETGTDEVAAPLFVKAGAGNVTIKVVARFSPVGVLPFGWYPSTDSTKRTTVGTMSMVADGQTSNKARMVYPPLAAGSAESFDPGAGSFGFWVYSDQKTQQFGEGGNPVNGDYDYSQDALSAPGNVHRIKSYPLKDANGTSIPQTFLVAVEEAANGDYQDYVFVMGNVSVAP